MRIAHDSFRAGTLALGLCTLAACNGSSSSGGDAPASLLPGGSSQPTRGYAVTVLVTGSNTAAAGDISGTSGTSTATVDPNLSKPWDLAAGDGPIRVASAHTTVMTTYDAGGAVQGDAVRIPGSRGGSHVTSLVDNSSGSGFAISANGTATPATYLFSTSSGTLAAWSAGTAAITVYADPAGTAEYTGLALLASGSSQFLYATDFQNGRIDTFDSNFSKIATAGNFRDPDLPAGYMPYNIQTVGNRLAVAYVKPRLENGVSTMGGAGEGVVDLFDASGRLDRRLATGGPLNAPRGIALAPDNFGELGGKILVANAGDGHINAFDRNTGAFAGSLNDAAGNAVTIPGVSALGFRNGDRIGADGTAGAGSAGDNSLFFTAGAENSLQSAFGSIRPAPVSGSDSSGATGTSSSGGTGTGTTVTAGGGSNGNPPGRSTP